MPDQTPNLPKPTENTDSTSGDTGWLTDFLRDFFKRFSQRFASFGAQGQKLIEISNENLCTLSPPSAISDEAKARKAGTETARPSRQA